MNIRSLDGFIDGDALVVGEGSATRVVRGVEASHPPLENASQGLLNQCEQELQQMLRSLRTGMALQVRWQMRSDLKRVLNGYYEETQAHAGNEWSKRQRNFHYCRMMDLMREGRLRHSVIQLYVSKDVDTRGGGSPLSGRVEATKKSLDTPLAEIVKGFERTGGRGRLMEATDWMRTCQDYFQVQSSQRSDRAVPQCEGAGSLFERFLAGDFVPRWNGGTHLHYNGLRHGFVALQALPQATTSGMIAPLLSLAVRDYAVTVRLEPIDAPAIVAREEREVAKLKRALRSSGQASLRSPIEMKEERIRRLMKGDVVAFDCHLYAHTWAESDDVLESNMGAIQTAINRLNGAKPYQVELPTSCRNAFFFCMPGSLSRDGLFTHYIEDRNLAHLLPVAGSGTMPDASGESLFQGSNGSLHTVNTFSKTDSDDSPMHGFITGQTGSGKSVFVMELLTQTEPSYDTTVIIDVGYSYAAYVKTFPEGINTFVIEGHGDTTLNYLSTQGKALHSEHIDSAATIIALMTGSFATEASYRVSLIHKLVKAFYRDWGAQWRKRSSSEGSEASAYTQMDEDAQPTHSDFHDWLETQEADDGYFNDDLRKLILVLERWRRDRGGYTLFDGKSTVSLNARVVHLELSKLSDASPELNRVATYVITSMLRWHIMNLPRGRRKRIVFEELGAFLNVPGGKEIVRDFYERMRKYHCVVVAVIQQVSLLPEDLAVSILGNSRQAFLFRQRYEADARVLQKAFNLSESAVRNLMGFPEPSREHGAPFLHWYCEGERSQVVTAFSVASPEMLYVSSSSGAHFEKRERDLERYDDILEGITQEAKKMEK